jgi:hypothetical protein
VINTTAILALPKGNILYEVWFGQKLPTDFQGYKETTRYARTALGGIGGEVKSNENSGSKGSEDSLFVNEDKEVAKEMILSKLTKRVTEHVRK